MLRLELEDVTLDQTITFWREGSIRGGTIKCGAHELNVDVNVISDEPPERIAELVRVARKVASPTAH